MNDTLSKLGLQCLEDFRAKIHVLSNMEGLAFDEAGYVGLPGGWPVELQAIEMNAAISTFEKLLAQLTSGFIPEDLVEDAAKQDSSSERGGARAGIEDKQFPSPFKSKNRTGQSLEGLSKPESKDVGPTTSELASRPQPYQDINVEWDAPEETTTNWHAPHFSPKQKERTQSPEKPGRILESGQEFKFLGGLGEMGSLFDVERSEPVYEDDQPDDQETAIWKTPSFAATPGQEVQREAVATRFAKLSLKSPEINVPAHKSPEYRNEWQAHPEMDAGQSSIPNTSEKERLSINLNVIMEELKEKLQNDYERHYGDQSWQ